MMPGQVVTADKKKEQQVFKKGSRVWVHLATGVKATEARERLKESNRQMIDDWRKLITNGQHHLQL